MKILVLGIGNSLLSDEGVGVHVIEALRQTSLGDQDDIELLDGGTLSFTLAGPIQDADALIVVDAAQLKSSPGTLQFFQGEEMDAFLMNNRRSSVHEVGLTDLRAIAMLAGHWPEQRAMIAIQPQKLDWGEYPTPEVAAAIPLACQHIEKLIGAWQNGSR
jgi:hydrogenase maturation protease